MLLRSKMTKSYMSSLWYIVFIGLAVTFGFCILLRPPANRLTTIQAGKSQSSLADLDVHQLKVVHEVDQLIANGFTNGTGMLFVDTKAFQNFIENNSIEESIKLTARLAPWMSEAQQLKAVNHLPSQPLVFSSLAEAEANVEKTKGAGALNETDAVKTESRTSE